MTTRQLYQELNYVNHSRESRFFYAQVMKTHPELVPKLLDILFSVNDKISPRAAWVFEFMCRENINTIIPYLDLFITNMHKVHLDSAVRPVVKICELIANQYASKANNCFKNILTESHKERIIENCFDYLIGNQKVGAKAYSMTTLFIFGQDYDWVHTELAHILEADFSKQSNAYKARARHILKKIKKNRSL